MYSISTELADLFVQVTQEYPAVAHLNTPELGIVFLYSDRKRKHGGKTVYAETEKVGEKMKALAGADFVITFYKPDTDMLDEDRLKVLMYHELRHVGYDPETGKTSIIPHDVEDFEDILSTRGFNWTER